MEQHTMDSEISERVDLCLRKLKKEEEMNWRKEKIYSCLSLLSGSVLFAGSCAWTMRILEKQLSRTNVAVGIAACSIGASISTAALTNLVYSWRACKISSKNCTPLGNLLNDLKATEKPSNTLPGVGLKGTETENLANCKLQMHPKGGVRDLSSTELGNNSVTELEILKELCKIFKSQTDSGLELSSFSNSEYAHILSEGQNLVRALEEQERITEYVNSLSQEQTINNSCLSEKNARLCKDIAMVLKQYKPTPRPSCSKGTCFFCSKDSRQHIARILQDHESYIRNINLNQQNMMLESNLPISPLSTSELLGAILHKQVLCVFSDYERHRQCSSTDNEGPSANVVVLYMLLRIVLEDFPKRAELAGLDIPQNPSPESISERLHCVNREVSGESRMSAENSFIQRIENAVLKGEHRIQKNIIEKFEELSDRFQRLQETKMASSSSGSHTTPLTNGFNVGSIPECTSISTQVILNEDFKRSLLLGPPKLPDTSDDYWRNTINLSPIPISWTEFLEDEPHSKTSDTEMPSNIRHSPRLHSPYHVESTKIFEQITQNIHDISKSELCNLLTNNSDTKSLVIEEIVSSNIEDMTKRESETESEDATYALDAETVSNSYEPLIVDIAEEATEA